MKKLLTFLLCAALLLACCATALADELEPQAVLVADQDYPVYSAPDTVGVPRGANNDAVLPAGTEYEVFCIDDEDASSIWLLIQYAVDKEHSRFGYISVDALPEDTEIEFAAWESKYAYLAQDASLTDDPLYSQSELAPLPEGQSVLVLASMGEWAYAESGSGDWVRGFVKQSMLHYDMVYYLADHSENLANGTLAVSPDGRLTLCMGLLTEDAPAAFLLKDELQGIEIGLTETSPDGDYLLEAALPDGTTSISFIPVGAEEALFRAEW